MKYLFIGGRLDGRRVELEWQPLYYRLPFVPRLTAMPTEFSPGETCDIEEYHRRIFQIAGVDFIVYTHGWMDLALIMQRLLDGYNKA